MNFFADHLSEEQAIPCGAANKDKMVSVIAIVHSDVGVLDDFLDEVAAVLAAHYDFYEIVLIDNHSSDGSWDLVRRKAETMANLRVLRLSRSRDREVALAAGIEHCVGDYAIIMDLYTDRPEDIPRMVAEAETGFDVVIARHTHKPQKKSARSAIYRLASVLLGQRLDPHATYFRLFSRRALGALSRIRQRRRFLKYFNAMVGFEQTIIDVQTHPRAAEAPRRRGFVGTLFRGVDILFSHSSCPLRAMSLLGILASLGNLAYLAYAFVVTLVKNEIAEGWLTTSVMIGSMFFVLFVMLTVLAEYIARIYDEVKDCPLYFIETEVESRINTQQGERHLNVA